MTMAAPEKAVDLLTYERYMEIYFEGRYEIVEGVLKPMPGPTVTHQIYSGNLYNDFRKYQKAARDGLALYAPCDILIRRKPRLRTRQPDLFYISNARLAQGGGIPEKGSLEAAPELVVEIISNSEIQSLIDGKTADYIEIGVAEMWRVWPETQTVEVVRLETTGPVVVQTYGQGQTVQSFTFPGLQVVVADIFAG